MQPQPPAAGGSGFVPIISMGLPGMPTVAVGVGARVNNNVEDKDAKPRWSGRRYYNPKIPSYIPPEFVIFHDGTPLDTFLERAQLDDMKRLLEAASCEQYYMRKDGPAKMEERFEIRGDRRVLINRYKAALERQHEEHRRAFDQRSRAYAAYHANLAAEANKREIVKMIFLSQDALDNRSYGAIIGARGEEHQKLQSETGCNIVLGGRGITDLIKELHCKEETLEAFDEKPHVRITAPTEAALQKAVERIEWILSDDPKAVEFRDEKRKKLALMNGTYDPETWDLKTEATMRAAKGLMPVQQTGTLDADLEELAAEFED